MHHGQNHKFQSDYKSDIIALVDAFEQLGNPLFEDSGELLDLDQSIFMPPDVLDYVRKVKETSDCNYTQHFLTSELVLRKRLSVLHCTKLIWSCSRLLCLNHAENQRYLLSKPTSENYPDFFGSLFWSHHQWLCVLQRKLYPTSLAYLERESSPWKQEWDPGLHCPCWSWQSETSDDICCAGWCCSHSNALSWKCCDHQRLINRCIRAIHPLLGWKK